MRVTCRKGKSVIEPELILFGEQIQVTGLNQKLPSNTMSQTRATRRASQIRVRVHGEQIQMIHVTRMNPTPLSSKQQPE